MRINLKSFLDYASHKNPQAVANAVIATVKKHSGKGRNMHGMGLPWSIDPNTGNLVPVGSSDTGSTAAMFTDPSLYSTDIIGNQPAFFPDGTVSPLANPTAVNNQTGQPATSAPWWQTLFTSLTSSAPALLTAYTANQQLTACSQTNQARLSQGLPAVDCSSFAPTAQVGLTSSTSGLLLLLGGGALLLMFMGGRRRTQ